MKARVYVTLKKGVLDPQGKAVMGALRSRGFTEVSDVRIGKFVEITIDDSSPEGASPGREQARLREMCEKLIANTVIEDYRIELD
ncbi:MAG: phosphoribosylformylglycinamidine synthase subunit PurS [Thermodesulfobacteriota bacterium]